jgi:hypothetical protein
LSDRRDVAFLVNEATTALGVPVDPPLPVVAGNGSEADINGLNAYTGVFGVNGGVGPPNTAKSAVAEEIGCTADAADGVRAKAG